MTRDEVIDSVIPAKGRNPVSGPSLQDATGDWGINSSQFSKKVQPRGIALFDQLKLPCSFPLLDRLLPPNCALHGFVALVPDQRMYAVALSESRHKDRSCAARHVERGWRSLQRTAFALLPAGKDIDARLFHIINPSGFRLSPERRCGGGCPPPLSRAPRRAAVRRSSRRREMCLLARIWTQGCFISSILVWIPAFAGRTVRWRLPSTPEPCTSQGSSQKVIPAGVKCACWQGYGRKAVSSPPSWSGFRLSPEGRCGGGCPPPLSRAPRKAAVRRSSRRREMCLLARIWTQGCFISSIPLDSGFRRKDGAVAVALHP